MTAELSASSISTPAAEQGAFTPGPWFVRANVEWLGDKICIGANADENGDPVDAPTKNGGVYVAHAIGPDREANARLIAAAPDMLAALQAAAGYLTNAAIDLQTGAPKRTALNTINGGLELVRAAIAKATDQ